MRRGETMAQSPPDVVEKNVKAKRFKCDGCGAEMKYNASVKKLKCDFCGAVKDVPAGEGAVVERDLFEGFATAPRGLGAATAVKTSRCQECGANVAFPDGATSTKCTFWARLACSSRRRTRTRCAPSRSCRFTSTRSKPTRRSAPGSPSCGFARR